MKKKIKYLVLLFIFFGALNVNAATVSKDGYTYNINGLKAEIFDINAEQMITNPNYLTNLISNENPERTIALDVNTFVTNPTISSTTSKNIPTHLIGLNINQSNLTNYITSQLGETNGHNYLARLIVTYRVAAFPQQHKTLAEHNGMEFAAGREEVYETLNISSQNTQVVEVIPLNGTNADFSSYAANCQMFFDNNQPSDTDWPTRIFAFRNSISEQTYDEYFDQLFASSTYNGTNNDSNDNGTNDGGNNGNTGDNGNSGTGNNGTGDNGTGNVTDGPTGNTDAPTDGGNNQVVKVDDTAMSMPISLYVGSTLLLLIGALVISKTMQIEEKQND